MAKLFSKITAFILLICSTPLLLIVSLLILIFERDKILFYQNRIGLNQKPFTIIKIRTMQHQKTTFLGRITQFDIDRLEWNTNFHKQRWSIKPGLTGLGQLSPICHKKMTLFWDNYYVKHQCFSLNLKIITLTCFTLFLGKNNVKKIIQNKIKK